MHHHMHQQAQGRHRSAKVRFVDIAAAGERSYADLRKVRPQGRRSQLDFPAMLKVQQPQTTLPILF